MLTKCKIRVKHQQLPGNPRKAHFLGWGESEEISLKEELSHPWIHKNKGDSKSLKKNRLIGIIMSFFSLKTLTTCILEQNIMEETYWGYTFNIL